MMGADTEIHKGLEGVLADKSAVSKVMPETNSLTYRGYAVQDLAAKCEIRLQERCDSTGVLAARLRHRDSGAAPPGFNGPEHKVDRTRLSVATHK